MNSMLNNLQVDAAIMPGKPRILIVDDEQQLCTSLKGCLGTQDYNIVTAYSGEEAVELLRTHDFDLALLDAVMPKMSGYQLMDYIYEHKPGTKVILMSGYVPIDFVKRASPKGACGCLTKPFDLNQLVTAVKTALKKNDPKNQKGESHQRQMP